MDDKTDYIITSAHIINRRRITLDIRYGSDHAYTIWFGRSRLGSFPTFDEAIDYARRFELGW